MTHHIGLDIGGTKIAGAIFDAAAGELGQKIYATPDNYADFVARILDVIAQLSAVCTDTPTVGIGMPYGAANLPFLVGKSVQKDLSDALGRTVPIENDANCAALAEAIDGAGQGYASVFGLIIGTGVGGGYVQNGRMLSGANGLMSEIGHLPLPHYEESDGDRVPCGCGQTGCLEKLVSGGALARLHHKMLGRESSAVDIATAARAGDADALSVLDRYYTVVAKAMVTVIHSFDPDIITVSGGLNALPDLYDEVPKRWGRYTIVKQPKTKIVPAKHGAMAGMRGAAWLGRNG